MRNQISRGLKVSISGKTAQQIFFRHSRGEVAQKRKPSKNLFMLLGRETPFEESSSFLELFRPFVQ